MPFIENPKRRGEWVEMQFMARAACHGLIVSKPWGESARYDFVVEHQGRFSRVQVKSTTNHHKSGYSCPCHGSRKDRPYTAEDIDFIAVFVIPEDVWYVVPVAHIRPSALTLEPRRPRNKYGRYMEAWHLLMGHPAGCFGAADPSSASCPASCNSAAARSASVSGTRT